MFQTGPILILAAMVLCWLGVVVFLVRKYGRGGWWFLTTAPVVLLFWPQVIYAIAVAACLAGLGCPNV